MCVVCFYLYVLRSRFTFTFYVYVLRLKIFKYIKMSFLKIDDPKKRDFIVSEFLKTNRNIQENSLAERLGRLPAKK